MQNHNLEKVSTLLQAKLQNHQLSRSLDRIAILLQSLLASTHMEVTDNMPLYNLRRNAAQFSEAPLFRWLRRYAKRRMESHLQIRDDDYGTGTR